MFNLLNKEMKAKGIIPLGDRKFQIDGSETSYVDAVKMFADRSFKNKQLLLALWEEVAGFVSQPTNGETDAGIRKLFIPALQNLYSLSSYFDTLHNRQVSQRIYSALCQDSNSFSTRAMRRVVEYWLGIEWTHHLIMRDLYSCALLRRYNKIASAPLNTEARGVSGPWANLDLPMEERVFEWDDIAEETMGRQEDIQHQPRYSMGLEDYHSPRVKEGFYWDEVRRYPYDFDDEDDNPYPHRNVLWQS